MEIAQAMDRVDDVRDVGEGVGKFGDIWAEDVVSFTEVVRSCDWAPEGEIGIIWIRD